MCFFTWELQESLDVYLDTMNQLSKIQHKLNVLNQEVGEKIYGHEI